MSKRAQLVAALISAACMCTSAAPAYIYTVPVNMSFDETILLYTAQGLANRAAPRVWYYNPGFWTDPESTYWFPPNFLTPQKGFTFTDYSNQTFCSFAAGIGLLASSGGPVTGLALYNASALDATRWLAVTQSALQGLLPVTASILANSSWYGCLSGLSVVVDYSKPASLGWSSNIGAYQWAQAHLMPSCSNASIYSAGHSFTDATESVYLGSDPAIVMGIDGAVAQKMMVFNLSPDTQKYPAHAAQFTALVAAVRQGNAATVPNLVGWAEPEPDMTMSTSVGGGSVLCDAAPNLSFWFLVSADKPPVLQYNAGGVAAPEQDHVYLAFQTNEGDTPKFAAGMFGGLWRDPARGSIPMGWGINPLMLQLAPGLLEFYAATATANDTWFSATAGAGYAYPSHMPQLSFTSYVQRAAGLITALTPGWPDYSWEVDLWDSNVPANVSSYAAVANAGTAPGTRPNVIGAFSMQPEAMAGTNTVLPGGLPLIITYKPLWYPFQGGPCPSDPDATFEQWIGEALAGIPTRPAFLLIYGVTYDACGRSMFQHAHTLQQRLGGGNATAGIPPLTVVGIQNFVALARQAAAMQQ